MPLADFALSVEGKPYPSRYLIIPFWPMIALTPCVAIFDNSHSAENAVTRLSNLAQ